MSRNFNNPLKFSPYNHGPMNLDDVMGVYKQYGIKPIRVELYHDFVQSLCERIFSTYLGDEVMDEEDRENHFVWSWDKTVDIYFKMGFDLSDSGEKFKYFKNFFSEIFYGIDSKDAQLEEDIIVVWEYIFNYHIIKPEKDVYNFVEIYKMFDNTNWFKK
jgi:hypothetical protein